MIKSFDWWASLRALWQRIARPQVSIHICAHAGCTQAGSPYWYPGQEGKPDLWLCDEHAKRYGICYSCGQWGKLLVNGRCDDCDWDAFSEGEYFDAEETDLKW